MSAAGCDAPHNRTPPKVPSSRCVVRQASNRGAGQLGRNEAAVVPLIALDRNDPRQGGGLKMERAMYFRRQAEALLGLSRATIDLGVARRLRTLAAEFQAKAEEIADEAADPAQVTGGRPGSPSGDLDRH